MKAKHILFAAIFLIIATLTFAGGNKELQKTETEQKVEQTESTKGNIIFAVPYAPVSYPIIKMIEDGTFDYTGRESELVLWKTPDQLKALVAGKQADFFAVPSNVGAVFYNKGIDVKLLNISIWKAIWMMSKDENKKTLADFKGEEIAMPFKGNMPHLVFMALARKQGLDPEKDFKLTYVPHPMDAAQQLMMGKVDNAMLIDPAASMVVLKAKQMNKNIYRSVDIQTEWGRLFGTADEIPYAGIMAGARVLEDAALVKKFNEEYKKAALWCMANPEETAKIAVKHIPQLKEKAVAEAMRNVTLVSIDASDAKERLEAFYNILMVSKPALIGGQLPDSNFYYDLY